ncbi:hypothetical protein FB451DRAFT_1516894 [Mycena latifolia]|nr:hypothetical protein FB451DRAFT_1516894 [Mycena latifolia]
MSFTRVGPGVISVQQSPKSCKVPPQPKQLSSEDDVRTCSLREQVAGTNTGCGQRRTVVVRNKFCRTHGRKLWTVGVAWYTPRHKDCTSTYWYGAVIATRQTWPVSGQDSLREKLERGRGLSAVQCATRIQRGRSECHQVAVMTAHPSRRKRVPRVAFTRDASHARSAAPSFSYIFRHPAGGDVCALPSDARANLTRLFGVLADSASPPRRDPPDASRLLLRYLTGPRTFHALDAWNMLKHRAASQLDFSWSRERGYAARSTLSARARTERVKPVTTVLAAAAPSSPPCPARKVFLLRAGASGPGTICASAPPSVFRVQFWSSWKESYNGYSRRAVSDSHCAVFAPSEPDEIPRLATLGFDGSGISGEGFKGCIAH